MYFETVEVKTSEIGQFDDGLGVFACKNFKKGEVVIKWNLKVLTEREYNTLPEYEKKNFCHKREGSIFFYPDPERHVNRSDKPNVASDMEKEANIALCDIKKGDEISISATTVEDF
ncbi:MAG: SET domain-containing protein [Candidatus Algichlamydia australiensis]|nr:SET domain-containing protein [Chlamydiales bacterium]